MEHLRFAAQSLPYAHEALAQMYREDGNKQLAQAELAIYEKLRTKDSLF